MKKPIIEVKCDATPEDTLVFRHTPYDIVPNEVWAVAATNDGRTIFIKMTCERARDLGKALLKVYGNDEPTKITI